MSAVNLPSPLNSQPLLVFTPSLGTAARTFSSTPDLGAYEWNPVSIQSNHKNIYSLNQAGGKVEVFDLMGRLVGSAVLQNQIIKGLYPGDGVYIIRQVSGDGSLQKKLLVQ